MDKITSLKAILLTIIGVAGSGIAEIFGGWTTDLQTLVIFMAIDFITGLIVAGVFKASIKTESGALESSTGFRGLCKKGVILLIVLICTRLDMSMGTEYIRTAAIIGFIVNEAISITENCGLMGIPLPSVVVKAIDVLKQTSEKDGK